MKLTWHIVWKDLRRHRWALGALALLHVGMIYGAELAFGSNLRGTGTGFGALWEARSTTPAAMLMAAAFVLSYVLVAGFVHGDPTVGATAEWVTRPITGARLFGAKVLGLVLGVVMVPIAVLLPWWVVCGYGWAEVGTTARAIGLFQGLIIVVGLPFAALTERYSRFLFWTLVGLVVLIGAALVTVPVTIPSPWAEARETRSAVAFWLIMATALAGTIHQFLTRRRNRSVVLVVSGFLAAWVVSLTWSWVWLRDEKPPAPANIKAAEITLVPSGVHVRARPSGLDEVRVPYVVRGVPEGWLVYGSGELQGEWRGADGRSFPAKVRAWSGHHHAEVRRLLGVKSWTEAEELKLMPMQWWFDLAKTQVEQLQSGKVSLNGVAPVRLKRTQVEGVQPLRVGDVWQGGAQARRIAHIGRSGDEVAVTVLERGLPMNQSGAWISFGLNVSRTEDLADFWILDRAGDRIFSATTKHRETMGIGGVEIRRTVVYLSARAVGGPDATEAEIVEKLGRMALAKLSYGEKVRLEVPVVAERLEVVGK